VQTICFLILILFTLHLFLVIGLPPSAPAALLLPVTRGAGETIPIQNTIRVNRAVRILISPPYRPPIPKLNADPASATDIPKKKPLGAGAA
jgi:hypothetical protein